VTEQTEQNVLKRKTENHIGFLTLNRPEQANALNRALFLALRNEMEALENDDDVRVIVMTGAGEEAFCAGIDLKERAQLPKHEILLFRERIIKPCFDALRSSPKPLIAAVNGVAFGGGAELALVCDMRVASERARFAQTEIRWGMIPACGACQRLRMIVGIGRAKEIILTGREVGADEALQWGIYNRVVPVGRLMDEARRLGAHILGSLEFEFEASKACYFSGEAMTGPEKF
jgi:enoyl-CoA hydratase/carnithine racemase